MYVETLNHYPCSVCRLSSLEKERELSESKELNTWMERASGARKVLMSFELAGEEQNAHSMDEVNSAIEELQVKYLYKEKIYFEDFCEININSCFRRYRDFFKT